MVGGDRCGVVVKGVRAFNDGDIYAVHPEDLYMVHSTLIARQCHRV